MFFKKLLSKVGNVSKQNRRLYGVSSLIGVTCAVGGVSFYIAKKEKVYAARIASEPLDVSSFMDSPITHSQILQENKNDIKTRMELLILKVQGEFCHVLEREETSGQKFLVDRWTRKNPKEGGGITCVLQNGDTFEKAGVNITVMRAPLSKKLQESMRSRGKDLPEDENFTFFAAGVSSVIHPKNPYVPTVHFNYRYFQVEDEKGNQKDWWFGGGTDLTPYYLDEDDVKHFHQTLKDVCNKDKRNFYSKFKKWCDNYFRIQFRGECRGVGGIFFDDMEGKDQSKVFQFVQDCTDSVIPSYLPLVQKNKAKEYGDNERRWQLLRRGRYTEFNLVYDRGTKFGFATPGARIESILMSLPLIASWEYRHEPEEGSEEEKLMKVLKNPRDWV